MKINKTISWKLIMICQSILFYSCEYQPTGSYEVTKIIPLNPVYNVTFDNFGAGRDTIYVYHTNDILLKLETGDNKVYSVKCLVDEKEVNSSFNYNSVSIDFLSTFKWGDLKDINYIDGDTVILKMETFISSGSGSLGDVFQAEGYKYINNFVVIFTKNKLDESQIISCEEENGILRINWSKYRGPNFNGYNLIRTIGDERTQIGTFSNLTDNHCYDPDFIGESTFYILNAGVGSTGKVSYNKLPKFTVEHYEDNRFIAKWTKNKFKNNLAGYEISYITSLGTKPIINTNNPNDTFIIFEKPKENVSNYLLTIVPKNNDKMFEYYKYLNYSVKATAKIIEKSFKYDKIFISYSDYLVFIFKEKLFRYESSSGKIKDSIDISGYESFYLTEYGDVFTAAKNNQLLLIGVSEFSSKKLFDFTAPDNSAITISKHCISDNGIFAFLDKNNSVSLYNIIDEYHINTIPFLNQIKDIKISNDGKFLCLQTDKSTLYKVGNDTIVEIWNDKKELQPVTYIDFLPLEKESLYLFGIRSLILDANELYKYQPYYVSGEQLINIDFNTDLILSHDINYLYINNIENDLKYKILKKSGENSPVLFKNYLYYPDGQKKYIYDFAQEI